MLTKKFSYNLLIEARMHIQVLLITLVQTYHIVSGPQRLVDAFFMLQQSVFELHQNNFSNDDVSVNNID